MKKYILFIIIISLFFGAGLLSPAYGLTGGTTPQPVPGGTPPTEPKTVPCPYDASQRCIKLDNPIPQTSNAQGVSQISLLIGIIIKAALGIIGSLALLMLVWGGFQWLVSAGNAEKVTQGTQTMLWAAIGVVVVLSSYLILNTFIKYLTGAK